MRKPFVLAVLSVGLALLLGSVGARADSFTFGTVPASGAISGPPGLTIGWGYTITNQSSSLWLVTTNLSADVFLNGIPNAFVFDLPAVPPLGTVTVPFDPVGLLGLFAFTWDATAPAGFVNSGTFILSAEFWTNNPLTGGIFSAFALDQSAPYSATVTPIPEPSTLLLLVTGLGGLGLCKKKILAR